MEKHMHPALISFFPLVASILIPFLVISSAGFAFGGVAISLIGIALYIYALKPEKTRFDTALLVLITTLSVFIILRANPLLIFFNIVAVFFLGSLLARTRGTHSFLATKLAPVLLFFKLLQLPPTILVRSPNKVGATLKKYFTSMEHLFSVLLTIVILLIIIPLLASTNPFFDTLVTTSIESLRLEAIIEYLFGDNSPVHIFRFVLFLILIFLIPRLHTFVAEKHSAPLMISPPASFPLLLPKIAVAFVIAVFFFTQIQLYLASPDALQEMGYTNSQQTREVFGQLAVVSLIIFLLIYNEESQKKRNRFLGYLLLTEGVFLTGIALKSVYDYSSTFGFTFKRLYGFAGVLWILGAYAGCISLYFQKLNKSQLVQGLILWTAIILVGINMVNFDYQIAHTNPARTGEGHDYTYMAYNLSSDARAYDVLLDELYYLRKDSLPEDNSPLHQTLYHIRWLQEKYSDRVDWRVFNLSEYRAYQQIRDINLSALESELSEQINRQFHQEQTAPEDITGTPQ